MIKPFIIVTHNHPDLISSLHILKRVEELERFVNEELREEDKPCFDYTPQGFELTELRKVLKSMAGLLEYAERNEMMKKGILMIKESFLHNMYEKTNHRLYPIDFFHEEYWIYLPKGETK